MKTEDKTLLESGRFDRAAWAALWDRLPDRMRRSTAEFVLQKLHAIESNGQFSMQWTYETAEEREASGGPIFENEQPGDVVRFHGSLQIGNRSS